jgi:hypothetical protein
MIQYVPRDGGGAIAGDSSIFPEFHANFTIVL